MLHDEPIQYIYRLHIDEIQRTKCNTGKNIRKNCTFQLSGKTMPLCRKKLHFVILMWGHVIAWSSKTHPLET
jgi:hypothetical protein